ncbi:F-box and leucine-rich repeat protein 2/20 [Marchantia polymorpha subsp. ruderalis]|uniref:F-box/LRR-repeat protein 15-like leucin rich repeat domain-containing protein n=2 Tax=Marchantia polymorpha TaxID=3197 RepID=A0AAF6BLJ8_MARPO|nr:hypothetical protein MARPO_0010s0090 [Marchantia polymorpha]BBN12882.1 hypothetical protein Mp_5g23660 [Marchantia polymorpha subsp. ruderalis]|eukprot:PTQ46692.1 hypothetical protein MARPO_0010s0090 [Marchantia polymorpha]
MTRRFLRCRPQSFADGSFAQLDDNLLLNVLSRLTDSADRQAYRLVCRRFLGLEANSRNSLHLFRVEGLEPLLRRYRDIQHLDLSACVLESDETLEIVGEYTGENLRSINLSSLNTFTEVGLSCLASKCSLLRDLDLTHCTQIGDQGMISLSNLKELESLKLVNCRNITDVGLGCVAAGCKKLKFLSLRWCLGISDVGISLVASNCNQLQTLDLSYTDVTSKGLNSITLLQSLKNLVMVSCNSVDDAALAVLKRCSKSLLRLDVARCVNVSERGIMALASGATPLQQLTLSYCSPITEALLKSFGKFESLLAIRLDGCDIAPNGLTFIGRGCKLLKEFSVCKCRGITDEGIQVIVNGCQNLHKLDLTCCRDLSDVTLASIASSCRQLRSLKMEACNLVTDKGLGLLANGCMSLEELDLTDTHINDEGLKYLARCTALRSLKLGYCLNLTDKGVGYIAASCCNLREIDLYRSTGIGDAGISALANGCRRLRVMNLSYCARITDASLHSISQLRDLNNLEIRACSLVTSVGLCSIAAGCKKLLELDLKHCVSIDDKGLIAIAQNCPNLRQVNLSFSPVGDEGLAAIARLSCIQNMKLIHIKEVSIEGLSSALPACTSLKKIKLEASLRVQLSPETQRIAESRGCRLRWMGKYQHSLEDLDD